MNIFTLIKRFSVFTLKILGSIVLLILLLNGLVYIRTVQYDFPPKIQFSGSYFYNPYQNCADETPTLKANFHAHTAAWKKMTNGCNTEQQLYDAYKKKGYDIVGISNYHKLSNYTKKKSDLDVPVYEHGFNVLKSHCLAINPKKVSFFDFPLLQTSSHQQLVINKIKSNNGFVALAHPNFGGGRSLENMKDLVHYDFVEVLNHYRVSNKEWDAALSNGRLSWLLADDDTHDVQDETAMKIWTVIYSRDRKLSTLFANMKKGMHYGVKTLNGNATNQLKSCKIQNDTIQLLFTETVATLSIYGQNGKKLAVQYAKTTFEYKIKPKDTFVRFVAENDSTEIFLNPIVRYDGKSLPLTSKVLPLTNIPKTLIVRGIIALFFLEIVFLFKKLWKVNSKSRSRQKQEMKLILRIFNRGGSREVNLQARFEKSTF
jgi:hypothetical protein